MPLDIILVAFLAVFVFLRLRSELGKKTGNEPQPPAAGIGGADQSRRSGEQYGEYIDHEPQEAEVIDLEENPALRHAYMDIRKADPGFDLAQFMDGAKTAYGMILEAFWKGDTDTLKDFLDKAVLAKFTAAIEGLEADDLKVDNQLLDVTKVEVASAELNDSVAQLTVHFTSDVVAVTRNKEGKIVQGDASGSVEMNDNWTFERDVKSRDPAWTLVATSAG